MKERIFCAAAELFAEHGYADTSIQDLAARVGIKSASIYYHYAAKEDILSEIIDYYIERMERFHSNMEYNMAHMDIRRDNLQESIEQLVFRYSPEEYQFMRWVSKVLHREMFRSEKAKDVMYGRGYRRYLHSYMNFFDRLYEAGILHTRDNNWMYGEMFLRCTVSFQPQFILPEIEHTTMEMADLYGVMLNMVLALDAQSASADENPLRSQ